MSVHRVFNMTAGCACPERDRGSQNAKQWYRRQLADRSLMTDSLLIVCVCVSCQVGTTSVDKECTVCYYKYGVSANVDKTISGCKPSFAHTLCVTNSLHVSNNQPKCPRCRGTRDHAIPKASVVFSLSSEEANEPPPSKTLRITN